MSRDRPEPSAAAVIVTGGFGRTQVDTDELRALEERLAEAGRVLDLGRTSLLRARGHLRWDGQRVPQRAEWAIGLVEAAVDGPGSFSSLEPVVAELEGSLRQARMAYEEAEGASRAPFGSPATPSWSAFAARVRTPHLVLSRSLGPALVSVRMLGDLPLGLVPGRSALAAALDALPLPDGPPGSRVPHGLATQRTVREAAAELQHYLPWFALPDGAELAGLPLGDLSPEQRALLPVALALQALPAVVVGGPRGDHAVEVTPVLPPREVPPATGGGDLLRAMDRLAPAAGGRPGTVEVRRVEHPDGRRTWTVLVPGTQHQGGGGSNPLDNLTNAEAFVGLPSDAEEGVARAMDQAGIAAGEEVTLVGHSQGGLTAMRLAADPVFATRYTVAAVLTAGSPAAHMPTPPRAHVLSLEHLEDVIPGLDGTPNPAEPRRTTVARSLTAGHAGPHRTDVGFSEAHAVTTYAQTADLAEASGDVSVRVWSERLAEASGAPGTVVTSTVFQVRRVPDG
ncbi:hypothetical protein [Georgenia faecalis]|uniref:hypothetical protein n=1 Tax=Georgenia faecalis TaxID=2483799 RepID=UPI000FDC2103|nr:hypothetical protein [Georgenia faecalis]